MAAALSIHLRKSNYSQKQNVLRPCASFAGCVWSWKFIQKALLLPTTLEMRFRVTHVNVFSNWYLCMNTEAHTHHNKAERATDIGSLGTCIYNSIVILHWYTDDFKTALQIVCHASECETSVTALSDYILKCSIREGISSHCGNNNHRSRIARKIGLLQDTLGVNVAFVTKNKNKNQIKVNFKPATVRGRRKPIEVKQLVSGI